LHLLLDLLPLIHNPTHSSIQPPYLSNMNASTPTGAAGNSEHDTENG
jgi:hypothetical protein